LLASAQNGGCDVAHPYLFFDGHCEEALRFYESCGLGMPVQSVFWGGHFGVNWMLVAEHAAPA
jgi:prepilin-type processing-associated H-X9-DG protein